MRSIISLDAEIYGGRFLIGRNQIGDDVYLMPGDTVALTAVSLLWSHREEKEKNKFLVSDSIPRRDEIERLEKVIRDLVPIIKCLNDPKGKKGEQSRAEQSRKIRRKGYWICPFSWVSIAIGWPRRSS
jgi:hypothetical protein